MQNLSIKNNESKNNKKDNVFKKLSRKITFGVNKISFKALALISTLLVGTPFYEAFADISNVNTDIDEQTAMTGIANVFVKVAKYIGFVLIFGGIMGIVEAQMSDNPERRSTAAKVLGAGVLFVGIEMVLKATGIAS